MPIIKPVIDFPEAATTPSTPRPRRALRLFKNREAIMRGGSLAVLFGAALALAQTLAAQAPDLAGLTGREKSELAPVIQRYSADRAALGRRWDVEYSPQRQARFRTSGSAT